jgi:hypothetical protein
MFPADTSQEKIFDNLKKMVCRSRPAFYGLKRNHTEQTRLPLSNEAEQKKWKRD